MTTQQQEQEVAIYPENRAWISDTEKQSIHELKPVFCTTLADDNNYRFTAEHLQSFKMEVIGLTSNYDKNIDWLRSNYNLYKRQYRDYAIDCNVHPARKEDYFLNCEHVGSGSFMLIIEKDNHFFQTYTVNKAVFYMPIDIFQKWVEERLSKNSDTNFNGWKEYCDDYYFKHRFDR